MCLPRQTGCSSESGRSLYASSGKISFMSCLKPDVEFAAAAARLGEDEASLLDKFPEVLPGQGGELGRLMAVEVDDRRLKQLGNAGDAGSTTCQVSRFFQLRETMFTMFRMSSGSLSQSPLGPWRSLLIKTGAPALGQKQKREAGRQHRVVLDECAPPGTVELVLVVHQLFGAQAIPVVLTEEPDAGQPAGTLQTIEVVELPLLPGAEVLSDLKVARRASRCPRWRFRLTPPEPQSWIVSPCRNSPPWNRLSPEMIRLETPAQVMLAVGLFESGV